MIHLIRPNKHWSPSEFQQWIQAYYDNFPSGERVLVALKDPFHQLAALYAGLLLGRRVFSANSKVSEVEYAQLRNLFLPQAEITESLISPSQKVYSLTLEKSNGLIGIATSGSSGSPKIVLHQTASLLASAKSYCDFYQVKDVHKLASPLPLHHIGGLMPFWRALEAKAELILPDENWQDALALNPSHISLVPAQLKYLIDTNTPLHQFECILIGAQALTQNLYDKAAALGAKISVSYGSSESCAQLAATRPGVNPHGSVGKVLPGRNVRLIENKIAFSGPACFYAYQDGLEDIKPFNSDGYFISQDIAEFDSEDNLYIQGRSDHIFKSGGENINPHLLEDILAQKLNANNAMIVPIKDVEFGHIVGLFVENVSADFLMQVKNLNHSLAAHQKIRHIRQLNKKNDLIKISRHELTSLMQKKLQPWNLNRLAPKLNSKPDLVFLHGFMGSQTSMQVLADKFSNDFNVWGIDLPFHGQHQNVDYHSWNEIIDELAFVLQRFSRLHLYGYSMGGRLALGVLERYPKLCTKIIIESAHPGLENEELKKERQLHETNIIKKMTDDFDGFLQAWYQADLFKLKSEQIEILSTHTAKTPKLYQKALQLYGLSQQPNLLHLTKQNDLVILVGEHDHKYRALWPNALVVKDAGHKASFENPQYVYELIMSWK